MNLRQLKHSLARNFIFAALAPLFTLSIIVTLHLGFDIKADVERNNQLLAKTVSGQVKLFLHEPKTVLENIGAMLTANSAHESSQIRQILNLHIRDSELFESIFLLNQDGVIINVGLPPDREEYSEDFIGVNLAHLPVYRTTQKLKKTTWSNTFLSVTSGEVSLALCIPGDEFSLIGNLKIQQLSDFVQTLNENHDIQVALVDKNGTIIVHPDPLLGKTQININNLQIIQDGFAGKESTSQYTFNNITYIGSTKLIAEPQWLVLVSEPLRLAYRGVSRTALYFAIVALGAAILVTVLAILKARKITTPITEITDLAQEIAGGNYDAKFSQSPFVEINTLTSSVQHMADAVQARENELRMSQKRFREIYNATSEAIFMRDIETLQLIDANTAMLDLFGYTLDELKQKSTVELSAGEPDSTQEKIKDRIAKTLHEGQQVFEWQYERNNGKSFWAEVTLKKAEIDDTVRLLGVMRNINERKTLERQLAQSQKMEAIGTLAGGIAHDFNNILTPILGYVELAMDDLDKPEQVRSDLDQVLKAVKRARDLVQQILVFSRSEEQQKKSPTNIAVIVKETLKLLRSTIPVTIKINQQIDPNCGTVLASPTQIHQVLMNLCTNAYHAMREKGGMLSISLQPLMITTPDNPALKNLPEGHYLCLEIGDTGHGMDKAILDRIMEPYYTTKKIDEGTGLGLSVVHGIVKGMGGDITVYSEVGQGSTFRVYLPVTEESHTAESNDQTQQPLTGNENLLLVDDEVAILNMHRDMLTRLGYQIHTFPEPQKALEFFTENHDRVDLLITDMTMPDMTGLELIKKIWEIEPEQPVILCTGFSESLNREQALSQGINEYLTKPVGSRQLALSIRNILDGKDSQRSSAPHN